MTNQDINSLSPIYRDMALIQNIGKYNQVTEPLINPIGTPIDTVYTKTGLLGT